ncbi:hypothetical protein Ddye_007604 [Dipteronia dyeriana]|uniref:Ubiquitin-like protease family profile domain-containing protein n=1 Tax=Dipteronia dyeriana TaxID=168575 RepID=A0AAD9XKR1_9ROSI|nr:hypothetical protein Ddye_007604 [Dipteronia dyeriana]
MNLVQALWGSTSQTAEEDPQSHDRDDLYRDFVGGRSPVDGADLARDVDVGQLEAYKAYKKNNSTRVEHDVDIMEPVDVGWFHRFEENYMELFDSMVCGRPYDSTWISPYRKPAVARGSYSLQHRTLNWLVASVNLTAGMIYILDPFRQEVPVNIRKRQVRPLKWFLPSILNQYGFHDDKSSGREKFKRENMAFGVSLLSKIALPQQQKSGNYGAHTLRLIEYILADIIHYDWTEDDMPTIRAKMAVEVLCNSQP